ncbi:MAG: hypothetical protein KGI50_05755 [Patescibacteria group bacterium]|nr:hypothetical protein [Patescibacteria group bacterium]
MYSRSRHSVNTNENNIVSMRIEESDIAKDLYHELRKVSGVRIELTDRAYSRIEQARIKKKYSYIQKGLGLGGANFWQILDETKHAVIIAAQFLWPWVVGHIAKDADDKIWEKVKRVVINSLRVLKRKKRTKNTVVLLINHPDQIQHEIALVLDKGLTDEQADQAFGLLPDAVQALGDPKDPGPTLRAFKYDPDKSVLTIIDPSDLK